GCSRRAWALARLSRSAASSLARQHFLYLLPLPQWQGSLRPGFGAGLAMVVGTVARREGASVVSRPVGRRHIPSVVARLRCRSGRRGARRTMRALRRRAAFRLLSAQAAGPALPARARARPALQLLLCGRRLSVAGDAALAALPRPQGLSCRDRGAGGDHAARRDDLPDGAPVASRRRRPTHRGALAEVVARQLHGNAV